jgi:hypothetical protein
VICSTSILVDGNPLPVPNAGLTAGPRRPLRTRPTVSRAHPKQGGNPHAKETPVRGCACGSPRAAAALAKSIEVEGPASLAGRGGVRGFPRRAGCDCQAADCRRRPSPGNRRRRRARGPVRRAAHEAARVATAASKPSSAWPAGPCSWRSRRSGSASGSSRGRSRSRSPRGCTERSTATSGTSDPPLADEGEGDVEGEEPVRDEPSGDTTSL